MELPSNTMLIHRKIYDETLLDIVDDTYINSDNSIELFLTHDNDKFIMKNYKNKISPILGYRFNNLDGSFNYLPLAIYTETQPFLLPYHNYIYDSNLNFVNQINIFNSFDEKEYRPCIMNILEQNLIKVKVPNKRKYYKK